MGKVVVSQFMSLDGVVEDPGGSEDFDRGGWAFKFDRGPEGDKFKLDEVMASEALLLGRVTFEGFAEAWPSRDGEFADKFNAMPKFVVSTTVHDPEWNNSTVIDDDIAGAVSKLKQELDGGHPGQRQRPAGADADGARSHRRVPPDGLSDRSRGGQAALRRYERASVAAPPGLKARGRHSHPHLCADGKRRPGVRGRCVTGSGGDPVKVERAAVAP